MRSCIGFCSALKVFVSIDLDGVKSFRIHFRRIEHDIVCCAIASIKRVRLESYRAIVGFLPVRDLPLMHESDSLCREYEDVVKMLYYVKIDLASHI